MPFTHELNDYDQEACTGNALKNRNCPLSDPPPESLSGIIIIGQFFLTKKLNALKGAGGVLAEKKFVIGSHKGSRKKEKKKI